MRVKPKYNGTYWWVLSGFILPPHSWREKWLWYQAGYWQGALDYHSVLPTKSVPAQTSGFGVTSKPKQVIPDPTMQLATCFNVALCASLQNVSLLRSLFDLPRLTVHGKAASSCHECTKQLQSSFFSCLPLRAWQHFLKVTSNIRRLSRAVVSVSPSDERHWG